MQYVLTLLAILDEFAKPFLTGIVATVFLRTRFPPAFLFTDTLAPLEVLDYLCLGGFTVLQLPACIRIRLEELLVLFIPVNFVPLLTFIFLRTF